MSVIRSTESETLDSSDISSLGRFALLWQTKDDEYDATFSSEIPREAFGRVRQ